MMGRFTKVTISYFKEREVSMLVRLSQICLVLICSSFCLADDIFFPDGRVTEILQVDSGAELRCKISGKSPIAGSRLRVHLRGIDSLTDSHAAKKFTEKALEQADEISLRKIRWRNYFRVIANVEVDGKDLGSELIKQGLAKSESISVSKLDKKKQISNLSRQKSEAKPALANPSIREKTSPGRIEKNSHSASSMESSPIGLDGESFNPDMTFEEAIKVIRNSVNTPLPIVVLWPEIERNSLVNRDSPIGLEWNGKIPVKKTLELLLLSVTPKESVGLQYYVDGGIITIASEKLKFDRRVIRVYDVAELTSISPAVHGGYGSGNRNRYDNNRQSSFDDRGHGRNDNDRYNNNSSSNNRNNRRNPRRRIGMGR